MRRTRDFRDVPQALEGVSNHPVDYDSRWPYSRTQSATGVLRYGTKSDYRSSQANQPSETGRE